MNRQGKIKLLILLPIALLIEGCVSLGNVTKIEDRQADTSITCLQPKNKFTQIIGFASVALDQHEISNWKDTDGVAERTQSYRRAKGCRIGRLTFIQDPNAQENVMCWESCNKYTKKYGFAVLKIDNTPEWAQESTSKHYSVIPYQVSRDDALEDF